jgi:hypothetical protein
MALLHQATLNPSKPELIAAWLPGQPWATDLPEVALIGGYRLDDPDGEVGMEGILLRSEDRTVVVHVPLTYRSAPLEGAEEHLLGTTEHSVLGTRWVYDAAHDPLFVNVLAATAVAGHSGAEEYFEIDGERVVREPRVRVRGSGAPEGAYPTGQPTDIQVSVVRKVGSLSRRAGDAALVGTWEGGTAVLAVVRLA